MINYFVVGGSYFFDIIVIIFVFKDKEFIFFVVSRGYYVEIGGIIFGSMLLFFKVIWEEGVVIKVFKLVENGVF